MQFTNSVLALLATASAAQAASILFHSWDNIQRTVYFTGNEDVSPVTVPGGQKITVQVPDDFNGNFYAVHDGASNTPGMLGEVQFNGWNGLTYFDVSAIVDGSDVDNIHMMHPQGQDSPISGCHIWPCDTAYWHPDDVQTQTTTSTNLVVNLRSNN